MNAVLAGMIGMPQVWIILVVVLVLFGGRKIPELMKGLGKGVKEFKNATNTEDENSKGEVEEPKK
ncbi:twin-arginine translocase TatA/TatE family subunit [Flavobacteriales bacterium]|nr:twin-arginine translocase TatA/TatE family subunit [Flavobacteriales bacterium]MDG1517519.1 twin-arginine translocase TatA/TatE family subunit [Flavobacteriales bacterium]|tara:strand:- start:14395 stop:14589 length:195 start_codon:yes stop_codon:yes gene_type:complete